MNVTVKNPRPLFRRELRQAPGHPLGERVLVREFPPESTTEGGLALAEVAKERYFAGTLVAVGDQAADKLYDLGVEIGDEIWFGKYAGIIQTWHHIVGEDNPKCAHDSAWEFVPRTDKGWDRAGVVPDDNKELRRCRSCETLRLSERVIALSVDDMCVDVDLQHRLESGEMRRERQETAEGQTRYMVVRDEKRPDRFEMKGAR